MADPGMSLGVLLTANLVMAIASVLQASVGMGFALLAVPLLALLEPRFVPGPMLLAGSLLALAITWRERSSLDLSGFTLSLSGLFIGTLLGGLTLSTVSTEHVAKIFAVLIFLAVALSLLGPRVTPTRLALFAGGGGAGIMGTMAGIHGPPIALVFQNARPEQARAMLNAFFFVAYVGSIAALAIFGLFGKLHTVLAAELLPGVICGILVAPFCTGFFNPARLRAAILSISAFSALLLLFR